MAGQLKHQVGGTAEAGQSQRLTVLQLRESQGTIANRTGTHEWRGLDIGKLGGYGKGIIGRGDHEFGIPTVNIPTRGDKLLGQILIGQSRRVVNPADADAVTLAPTLDAFAHLIDVPNHLVPRDDGQTRRRRPTFDLVQFGVTDAASRDAKANLPPTGLRHRQLGRRTSGSDDVSRDTMRGKTIAFMTVSRLNQRIRSPSHDGEYTERAAGPSERCPASDRRASYSGTNTTATRLRSAR